MNNSISLLLGAGFSAPMGYPIGSDLNDKLLNFTTNKTAFSSDGRLVVSTNGKKPDFGYTNSYDTNCDFLLDLIKYYNQQIKQFDYEEFYDYLVDRAKSDEEAKKATNKYLRYDDYDQLIYGSKSIYNQLISFHLKDKR